MRIQFFEELDGSIPKDDLNRKQINEADQFALVKLLQKELQDTDEPLGLSLDVGTPGRLEVQIYRHGKALAALWIAKSADGESDLVAFTAFLAGGNGADDVAAVESLKQHGPSTDARAYNKILSLDRPCIVAFYLSVEWFKNSLVNMAAMALAVAHVGGPDANPTIIEPDRPMTPEEEAAQRKRVEKVMRVWKIMQEDWARRGKLLYNVRAQEKIKGRPIAQIMNVKLWAGVDGQGGEVLDIHELAAVFDMLQGYKEQVPGMKYLKKPQTNHVVNLLRQPHELASYIQNIKIGEPK